MRITSLLESATIPPQTQNYRRCLQKLPAKVMLSFSTNPPEVRKVIDILVGSSRFYANSNKLDLTEQSIKELIKTYPVVAVKTTERVLVSVPLLVDNDTVVYSYPIPADLEENYETIYQFYYHLAASNLPYYLNITSSTGQEMTIPCVQTSLRDCTIGDKSTTANTFQHLLSVITATPNREEVINKVKTIISTELNDLVTWSTVIRTGKYPLLIIDLYIKDSVIRVQYEIRNNYIKPSRMEIVAVTTEFPITGKNIPLEQLDKFLKEHLTTLQKSIKTLTNTYNRDIKKVLEPSLPFISLFYDKKVKAWILGGDKGTVQIDRPLGLSAYTGTDLKTRKDLIEKQGLVFVNSDGKVSLSSDMFKDVYEHPEKLRELRKEFLKRLRKLVD